MTPYTKRVCAATKRMAEDMLIRNMAITTIDSYTYHVDRMAKYFGKQPEDITPEEIRTFQLWMIQEKKCSWSAFNQAVCGLRFLYTFTLPREWVVQMIPFGNRPKKLPVVLGQSEVHRLIECVTVPKHRAVLLTLYAAGLRLSEATNLKLPDIDSERMQLRIIQAKGHKDRYVPLSPRLLAELRAYWKHDRPKNYIFPGKTNDVPLSGATIQRTCKMAAAQAHSSAMSKVDRSIAAVTIGTVADKETATHGELASAPETESEFAADLTVHSIVKRFTPAFIAKHRETTAAQVESTLARLGFCRTAPLGGRTFTCKTCESQVSMYNSCGDRHCPLCSGARRGDWLDKAAKLLLPDVTYFQVVFTLPDKLSSLVLGNRRGLYAALMRAAAESLEQVIASECGMQSAALIVLHTWNQRLGHHPHVHALVPGSGPSLDGKRWISHRMTKRTRSKPARPFLVDNKRLSAAFRDRFLRQIKSLHRRGKLELGGTVAELADPKRWNAFIDSLLEKDRCVFIEPPPTAESSLKQVLKYLARYMTGGPISDQRLVSCENGIVTFKARPGDKQKSKQQIDVHQSGVEFVRNWSLHILPKGFTKSRGFGGYSSRNSTFFIALCQQLKPPPLAPAKEAKDSSQAADAPPTTDELRCPICLSCRQPDGRPQPRLLTSRTFRPRWRDLFYGPDHPQWFES